MGISLIKWWLPWNEEDLAILFKASVVCWWSCWVLCVNAVWCLNIDWSQMGSVWGSVGLHKHGGCKHLIRSLWALHIINRLLWFTKVISWPGWGQICFIRAIWACDIAFSIKLSVFSSAEMHACVMLVISLDTLSKFLNSCVILLNCYKVTVDWLCASTLLF